MDRSLCWVVEEGGDGREEDKRHKEEKHKDTEDGESKKEVGCVVFDIFQARHIFHKRIFFCHLVWNTIG